MDESTFVEERRSAVEIPVVGMRVKQLGISVSWMMQKFEEKRESAIRLPLVHNQEINVV